MTRRHLFPYTALAVGIVLLMCSAPACERMWLSNEPLTPEGRQALRGETDRLSAALEGAEDMLEALRAQIAATSDPGKIRRLSTTLDTARTTIVALRAALNAANVRLDAAGVSVSGLGHTITTVTEAAAPFIPPPWNMILTAAGSLIGGGILGARRVRKRELEPTVTALANATIDGVIDFRARGTDIAAEMGEVNSKLRARIRGIRDANTKSTPATSG